jgi:P27 family predicted phage terminase small subunit
VNFKVAKRGRKTKADEQGRKARRPAPGDRWACPGHLSGMPEAASAWAHAVELLRENGTLDATDPTLIEAYATARAMLRAAVQTVELEGLTVTGAHGGMAQNPACGIADKALLRLRGLIADMGLSPASAKLSNAGKPTSPGESKWGDLLGVVG